MSAPKQTEQATIVAPIEQEELIVTKEDREIARWALSERVKRKYPKRPVPRWFDRGDVEMVATCTATVEGDRAVKEQAHREAIAGAFCASKEGPPTSRFIWGTFEHFREHIDRGRKKLRSESVEEQRRQRGRDDDERSRQLFRVGIDAAGERARRHPASRAELAKMRLEFEDMATRAAPEFREVLESMITQYRELETRAPEPIPSAQINADLERLFGPGWKTHVPR